MRLLTREPSPDFRDRRRRLSLPHSAKGVLQASLAKLQALSASRAWTLPDTKFPDEVTHYRTRHTALALAGPRPSLRAALDDETAQKMALKIDAGLKFLDLAEGADPAVKPILLYYASAHLCGVYTRAFFTWEQDARLHGLTCDFRRPIGQTAVRIEERGHFPRLATCFMLFGYPNLFCELVTYSAAPTAHTGAGELLERFGRVELGVPVSRLTLEEIAGFDYRGRLQELRVRHGFHKFTDRCATAFLVDVLLLFMASGLARYDVIRWREILEGKTNAHRLLFDSVFDRFEAFSADRLLAMLEDPLVTFESPLAPDRPSPYDNDQYKAN